MVAMGCGMDVYMELKPELTGRRAGGEAAEVAGSARRWFLSFSSRRHLALLLLNHTWNTRNTPGEIRLSRQTTRRELFPGFIFIHANDEFGKMRFSINYIGVHYEVFDGLKFDYE